MEFISPSAGNRRLQSSGFPAGGGNSIDVPPHQRLGKTDFEKTDAPDDLPQDVEVEVATYVHPEADDIQFPRDIDVRGHGLDVEVVDRERSARTHEGGVIGQRFQFALRLTGETPAEGVVEFLGLGERLAAFDVSI